MMTFIYYYNLLCRNYKGAELRIYLKEGTYQYIP